jgi:plastocyanin
MKTSGILLILGIVLLLAGGVYLLTQNKTSVPINNPPVNNSPATGNPETHNIDIAGFAFAPATLNIKAGDIVIWTNSDSVQHKIVSDSGTELSSSGLNNGQTYTHTFATAGTYAYHCAIHPTMKGTIIVS